ncbi:MAG: hypothetical protein NE330_13945 [Lentisphaeraceae bacterium]|nr:hypothetical protein [Lentisphaeraceae bacterium]
MFKRSTKKYIAVICIIVGGLFTVKYFHENSQRKIKQTCTWITKNGGNYIEHEHYWQKFLPNILNKNVTGKIVSVDLSYSFLEDLTPLQCLKYIKILKLNHVAIQSSNGLEKLTSLEKLDLSHFSKDYIPELSKLENLIELDLSHSSVQALPNLKNLSQLKSLDISSASFLNHKDLSKQLKEITVQIISTNK